jgi:hypothetical protein
MSSTAVCLDCPQAKLAHFRGINCDGCLRYNYSSSKAYMSHATFNVDVYGD